MEFTERENLLIVNALHELESQCYADEVHPEKVSELGGTPDPEEVRRLMDRFKGETKCS